MGVKISELTTASTLAGTEQLEVVQSSTSKKTTVDDIALKSKTLSELNTQVSDATIARTDATQTFTGAQQTGVTTLSDGATISIDASANNAFQVTLGGNRTLANPTNLAAGMSWTVRVIQDGTGSRSLSFGSYYDWGDDNTAVDTSADGAAKERLLTFYCVTTTKVLAADAVGVY